MGADGADGNNLRHMNTLSGGDVSWLLGAEIKKNQILQYTYPTEKEMIESNLRIIFLGYFWKDWSLIDNGNFSALRGLDVRNERPWEIGDPVGISALDENWVTVNQMIKYLKFGFGRVTDYLNEDIRLGRISRENAIKICGKYDGKCSDIYVQTFSDYIGITVEQFWSQVDLAVNKKLFIRRGMGVYEPVFEIGIGL